MNLASRFRRGFRARVLGFVVETREEVLDRQILAQTADNNLHTNGYSSSDATVAYVGTIECKDHALSLHMTVCGSMSDSIALDMSNCRLPCSHPNETDSATVALFIMQIPSCRSLWALCAGLVARHR